MVVDDDDSMDGLETTENAMETGKKLHPALTLE